MPNRDSFPEEVKQFIFAYIDSVEQLEVLFLLYRDPDDKWTPERMSAELRSSPSSIEGRLKALEAHGLIKRSSEASLDYFYQGSRPETDLLLSQLQSLYQSRRHKILELIFSPLKRARDFADAFRLSKSNSDEGEGNG